MKHLKKADWLSVILCLCLMIPGAAVYNRLPERIVTNWNIRFEEAATQPKAFVIFGCPLIGALLTLICCLYAGRLEKKQRAGKLPDIIRILFPLSLYLAQGMILLFALGKMQDVRLITFLNVSVLLTALGNYLPKLRRNWIVGIRTPHILKSEIVWYKTHRFGGVVFTVCGLTAFITTLLECFHATVFLILVSVVIPAVYGEIIYYLEKRKQNSVPESTETGSK